MLAKSWSAGNAIQLNNHKISPVLSVQRLIIFLTYSSVFHRENLRSVVTFLLDVITSQLHGPGLIYFLEAPSLMFSVWV